MNAKKLTKRDAEKAFSDLLRAFRRSPAWLLEQLIEGLMEDKHCSRDQAIRRLAEMETMLRYMLEATQSIDEAHWPNLTVQEDE